MRQGQNNLEASRDRKSQKDLGHKTFPLGGRRLEWGGSLRGGRGQPATVARGEPDRMTSSAAPPGMRRLGRGQGAWSISPAVPPAPHFPLSSPASPRGPTFRHIAPSPFLRFLSQGRKERRRPSARPLLPQPALPLTRPKSLRPSAPPGQYKTTPKLGGTPRRCCGRRLGLPVGTGGAFGRLASPPRPAPAPGRLGGCRVPPPASTPTRLALLPSLREPRGPGAGGRGADAAAGAAAARRGAQPGRVAGPVCAALAAGSAGWLRGRGRGVGALPPRASLLPPAGGAGPPPGHRSGRPGEPEGGRVGAGPGSGPPPRAARGDPGNVRVPGRGDAGRRQPPPPPAPRGGPGGSQT